MQLSQVEHQLRERGLSLTRQRVAIVSVLSGHTGHPTASEIYEAVVDLEPASRSTVYNTLALFAELGLVRTLPSATGELRYDPNVEHHHHFRCTACGGLTDVPSDEVQVAWTAEGYAVSSVSVVVEGVCPSC